MTGLAKQNDKLLLSTYSTINNQSNFSTINTTTNLNNENLNQNEYENRNNSTSFAIKRAQLRSANGPRQHTSFGRIGSFNNWIVNNDNTNNTVSTNSKTWQPTNFSE